MKKTTKIISGVVGVAVAAGAITGGTLYYQSHTQKLLIADYTSAVEDLGSSLNTLAERNASLWALQEEILSTLDEDSPFKEEVTELVLPVHTDSLALLSDGVATTLDFTGSYLTIDSQPILDRVWVVGDTSLSTQSGAQSGAQSGSQSGSQSGNEGYSEITFTEMVTELGYFTADSEEAQSGSEEAQSGSEEAQSGSEEASDTVIQVREPFITLDVVIPDPITREQVDEVKTLVTEVGSQTVAVEDTAVLLLTKQYVFEYNSALSAYTKVSEALTKQIESAKTVLKDSDGKVADAATREALQKAIDAANKVATKNTVDSSTLSEVKDLTKDKSSETKSVKDAVKAVNDSIAAKTEADRVAAEKAAAEAARQAASSSGYSSSGGYSSGGYSSGGSSYSGSSGGSYSGGSSSGSSGGSSSGGIGVIIGGVSPGGGTACTEGSMMQSSLGVTLQCKGGLWEVV